MAEQIGRRAWLQTVAASGAAVSLLPRNALAAGNKPVEAARASAKPFRFVHLADIHVQPELQAEAGMVKCLAAVEALDPKPDFILTGGDLVMDTFNEDAARSTILFELYRKVLADHTGIPVHQCIGNHDVFGWGNERGSSPEHPQYGKKMVSEMLDLPQTYYTFDCGGWRFFVLDDIQPTDDHRYEAYLDEAQRAWLETELKAKDPAMPAAVVCHIPILSVTVFDDSEIFRGGKHQVSSSRMCRDSIDLVALLSKYNVRLALSGHMHMLDRIDYRGVTFISEGAVSGAWWKGRHKGFAEGFGIIDCIPSGGFQHGYHQYGWNAST